MSTRTIEQEEKYQEQIINLKSKLGFCPFHDDTNRKPIQQHKYWIMYENDFPYEWTDEHYLLFTKRHTDTPNEEELKELNEIALDLDPMHYVLLRNLPVLTSVWCYHYHIIKPKN